jgi:hypothetical protein
MNDSSWIETNQPILTLLFLIFVHYVCIVNKNELSTLPPINTHIYLYGLFFFY